MLKNNTQIKVNKKNQHYIGKLKESIGGKSRQTTKQNGEIKGRNSVVHQCILKKKL